MIYVSLVTAASCLVAVAQSAVIKKVEINDRTLLLEVGARLPTGHVAYSWRHRWFVIYDLGQDRVVGSRSLAAP